MTNENWHSEFNPSKFLSRVDLAKLIERNEAYNETSISDAKSACMLCGNSQSQGILLNDKSFLCQQCYSEVALISYPERYEALRRQFIIANEARKLAWEELRERFECKPEQSALVFLGWASLVLALASPAILILTVILLTIGYSKNSTNKKKTEEWLMRKTQWERSNPVPPEPTLKHFHDPTAELTQRDRQILKIFNHWPVISSFLEIPSHSSHQQRLSSLPSNGMPFSIRITRSPHATRCRRWPPFPRKSCDAMRFSPCA